jgi:hypothetical protein
MSSVVGISGEGAEADKWPELSLEGVVREIRHPFSLIPASRLVGQPKTWTWMSSVPTRPLWDFLNATGNI